MSDPYAPPYNQPGPGAAVPAPTGPPGPGQWAAPGYGQPAAPHFPGYPQQYYALPGYGYYPGPVKSQQTSGMTTAALVIGIVAAVISIVPFVGLFSYLLGPLAMVLGIVSLAKGLHRRGFAVAGLVTGAFALLVCILYTLLLPTLLMMASSDTEEYGFEVTSDGAFDTVVITTSLLTPETASHTGDFSATMEASPLIGSVTAINAPGNSGEITCVIYDAEGTVQVEDYARGPDAQVQCLLADVWDPALGDEPIDFEAGAYLR